MPKAKTTLSPAIVAALEAEGWRIKPPAPTQPPAFTPTPAAKQAAHELLRRIMAHPIQGIGGRATVGDVLRAAFPSPGELAALLEIGVRRGEHFGRPGAYFSTRSATLAELARGLSARGLPGRLLSKLPGATPSTEISPIRFGASIERATWLPIETIRGAH